MILFDDFRLNFLVSECMLLSLINFNSCFKLSVITTLGGGLESDQTVPGQLADFNMWQREMTLNELNLLTCGTIGDVVSWNTLKEEGVSIRTEKEFTACHGKQFMSNFEKILIAS